MFHGVAVLAAACDAGEQRGAVVQHQDRVHSLVTDRHLAYEWNSY